jgi:hypothetical protein
MNAMNDMNDMNAMNDMNVHPISQNLHQAIKEMLRAK